MDLTRLPPPIRRYLRAADVVGRPHVRNFRALMHGRIRSGPTAPWMRFTAEQFSFFTGPQRARFFFMKAARLMVPFHVFHRYADAAATMQVKLFGMLSVASASGASMTRAETVTMFNDMCVFAPATLIDPDIAWEEQDASRVRARFANGGYTISAELSFNDAGELTDFWSGDRLQTQPDGTMRVIPWSTPVRGYRSFDGTRIGAYGEGRWHEAGGDFAYVEIDLDSLQYNVTRR
jgi:hypothetical protein